MLREAATGGPSCGGAVYSTLNTSKGGGSVDIGKMSLRDLRREDQALIDDLSDQVKTKEEEIQILWNVIKEINKIKGGTLNIGQLQKLMARAENAAALHSSNNSTAAEALQLNFATPAHANGSSRY